MLLLIFESDLARLYPRAVSRQYEGKYIHKCKQVSECHQAVEKVISYRTNLYNMSFIFIMPCVSRACTPLSFLGSNIHMKYTGEVSTHNNE